MSLDIDYGDTEDLVTRPLRYCANPKVLYDLKQLNLYVTRTDLARIIDHLNTDYGCTFTCCVWMEGKWSKSHKSSKEAKEMVLSERWGSRENAYRWIYAAVVPVDIPDSAVADTKHEDLFWKRHEVIRISSPTNMVFGGVIGSLFYISFSNEYVENERIVRKSPHFLELTTRLQHWLKANFVSWRGNGCFDNPDENTRLFGDRFRNNKPR
jgi:hypothetical protein